MVGTERRTRAELKGIALALANVLVIAIAIGVGEHDPEVTVFVMLFAGIPAVVLGGLLGLVAALSERKSPRWRAVLLALPAFGLVAVLAATFGLTTLVPVACIPTLVAALVLERWTRHVEPPPVPVATVRSSRA
ncbi:MAG TPA: hypothetical protein VHW23_29575 [Kofleriaceae bacterium]|jgi:peptidoglycan/LPS O-acetylase OafA/YrhL|nr:hypothetical protein [Kofleriaceae bacterium]